MTILNEFWSNQRDFKARNFWRTSVDHMSVSKVKQLASPAEVS